MTDSWPRLFGRINRSGVGRRRRDKNRVGRGTAHLRHEHLEKRALLAITAVVGGGQSNSLIVASSPDFSDAAADDIFVTRSAAGNLLVASDSSFSPTNLQGNYSTPSILYVTNGEQGAGPGTMQPGDNRTLINGGPGYGQDAGLSRQTTFVLRTGAIARARNLTNALGDVFPEPNPPGGLAAQFPLQRVNRFFGTIGYDSGTWQFEMDTSGRIWFWQVTPSASGVAPVQFDWSRGSSDEVRGNGVRGQVDVTWSAPVASVAHASVAVPQPPVLRQMNYAWDNGTESENQIRPSAGSTTGVQFDVGTYSRAYETGQIIEGTLRGTLNIDSLVTGQSSARGLSIPFTTDVRDGGGVRPLYFDGNLEGEVDWLKVSGNYLPNGVISLSFTNRYVGDDFDESQPGSTQIAVRPGPVSISDVTFLQYANPVLPSDFTLWAGYDLPSQLWADLRSSGSAINIDSPVIVAPPRSASDVIDIDLRATEINVSARMQSRDDLRVAASRAGNPSETVTIDANIAVPNTVDINISDDPVTTDVTRGQLLVSQTGSIGGTFTNVPPPFGGTGTAITAEAEPNDTNVQANDIGSSFRSLGNDTYLTSITGAITPANDRDFFELVLRPFDTLQVSVYGLTLSDPVLRLETASGSQLEFNDDYYGLNPYVRYVNNTGANQQVFVRVTSFGGGRAGTYRMEAIVEGAPIAVTGTVLVTANTSDVFVEGVVAGVNQSYLMRSFAADKEKAPFVLTTTSPRTGATVGQIRGATLQVLMANEADTPLDDSIAFNTVDIVTAVDSLRVRASIKQNGVVTSPSGPFPYEFTLRELDGVSVDAVPASSRELSFTSDGPMAWTAALATTGDVNVSTRNLSPGYSSFTASAPITSRVGSIDIHASEIVLGSTLAVSVQAPTDPTRNDITLTAENGGVVVNGVLRSPNGISVVQRGKGATLVAGTGRVRTGTLSVLANAVGRSDLSPGDSQFYLRTDVDSMSAEVQTGFAIDEVNDVSVSYLRSPSGLVAIRANGFDERPGSVNGPALSATLIDVGNLYVSAPNGSIDLRNDTGKRLQLGIPTSLAAGSVASMTAAGSVTIITSSGGVDVYDAPFAGSGARRVDAATVAIITSALYDKGTAGQKAGTITALVNGAIQSHSAFAGVGRVLRVGDRVLVKDGLRRPSGTRNDLANGVYTVRALGSATTRWTLVRAGDSDTLDELPTNAVVFDSDRGQYWRLQHGTPDRQSFGTLPVTVQGRSDGYVPVTTITPSLVVPANDVRYVVSSSDGTNTGPGSLGKMIRLRQENTPVDPTLVQSIAFSRLLTQPIVLREELPAIRVPMVLDANVSARVLPPGNTAPQGTAAIVVNGQQITATQKGAALYRGTTSGTVTRATPSRVSLSAVYPDTPELRVGMAVAGNGVPPGTVIRSIAPWTGAPGAGSTVLELSKPLDAIFNPVTNLATLTLTFSTEINGLAFVEQAAGSRVAALNVGGFTSGAAVKVTVGDPAVPPSWAPVPLTEPIRGVTLDQVNIGSDGAATPTRLGNQVGVLVAESGSASIVGGQITSNSIAGVMTIDRGGVWVYGTIIGTQSLPNIVGLDLGGGSATIGRVSSVQLPNAADTFVEFNRRGIVLRAGTNLVQNTQVNSNSFEGISVEGGTNQIGNASRTRFRTGAGAVDSNLIVRNGSWGLSIRSAALATARIFDNVFGSNPTQVDPNANVLGNVGIDGVAAGRPFVADSRTLLDDNGNQHGGAVVARPPTGVSRPWQPRK
jgi:hypothetical protein